MTELPGFQPSDVPASLDIMPMRSDLVESVTLFAERARSLVVSDDKSYAGAVQALRELATLDREIDNHKTQRTKPLNETLRRIRAEYEPLGSLLVQARLDLSKSIREWERKREEERKKEEERAQRAAERERERLAKRAEKAAETGDLEKAAVLEQQAEMVTAPVVAPPPKPKGLAQREVWKFEITDPTLLPREYLMPNETLIGNVVRASKGVAVIPGVRTWAEKTDVISSVPRRTA